MRCDLLEWGRESAASTTQNTRIENEIETNCKRMLTNAVRCKVHFRSALMLCTCKMCSPCIYIPFFLMFRRLVVLLSISLLLCFFFCWYQFDVATSLYVSCHFTFSSIFPMFKSKLHAINFSYIFFSRISFYGFVYHILHSTSTRSKMH